MNACLLCNCYTILSYSNRYLLLVFNDTVTIRDWNPRELNILGFSCLLLEAEFWLSSL